MTKYTHLDMETIPETVCSYSNYTDLGTTSKKISWGASTTAAALAAIIAVTVGGVSATVVIAKTGNIKGYSSTSSIW